MELADSLRKTNPKDGGLIFCNFREGVAAFLQRHPAGRALLVSAAEGIALSCGFSSPRLFSVIQDGNDCLPLFAASDDVACVIAVGGENTLRAARFFAGVQNIPVALFPSDAALDGVFAKTGTVQAGKVTMQAPLKQGEIFCDADFMRPSLRRAYARLLLGRLALTELHALRCFGVLRGEYEAEEGLCNAFAALESETPDIGEVAAGNAVLRAAESGGMPEGEGVALSRIPECGGAERAYFLLSALYLTFFRKGKPRPVVPDYAARARAAGTAYARQYVPTPREYAYRAIALEKHRAELRKEMENIIGETALFSSRTAEDGAARANGKELSALKMLPERAGGFSCIIRDFGLMEWETDKVFEDDLFFWKSV